MIDNVCKNCGKDIKVMIFRGGDWCSDYCRKVLLGKIKCYYEVMWTDEVGEIDVCQVHGQNSKYAPRFGPNRPCLAIDPYHEDVG